MTPCSSVTWLAPIDVHSLLLLRGQLGRRRKRRRGGGQLDEPAVPPLSARRLGPARAGRADPGREHGAQALDQRKPVVVGEQTRQGHLVRQQERIAAGARDRLDLDLWIFRPERDHEAVGAPPSERNRHAVAGHDVHAVRHGVGVGLAARAARRLDRHLGVQQAPRSCSAEGPPGPGCGPPSRAWSSCRAHGSSRRRR